MFKQVLHRVEEFGLKAKVVLNILYDLRIMLSLGEENYIGGVQDSPSAPRAGNMSQWLWC